MILSPVCSHQRARETSLQCRSVLGPPPLRTLQWLLYLAAYKSLSDSGGPDPSCWSLLPHPSPLASGQPLLEASLPVHQHSPLCLERSSSKAVFLSAFCISFRFCLRCSFPVRSSLISLFKNVDTSANSLPVS